MLKLARTPMDKPDTHTRFQYAAAANAMLASAVFAAARRLSWCAECPLILLLS